MTARFGAVFGLAWTVLAADGPVSRELQPATVGVIVKYHQTPAKDFLKQIQEEVRRIFRPSGLDVRWEVLNGNLQPGTYTRTVVLDLRGRCDPSRLPLVGYGLDGALRLGDALVSDGEVIPHTMLDCDAVAVVVAGMRTHLPSRHLLPELYRKVAGRVVAHELLHVLLRTADHDESDYLKSPLRTTDLLYEARLKSKEVASLREIGRRPGAVMARSSEPRR